MTYDYLCVLDLNSTNTDALKLLNKNGLCNLIKYKTYRSSFFFIDQTSKLIIPNNGKIFGYDLIGNINIYLYNRFITYNKIESAPIFNYNNNFTFKFLFYQKDFHLSKENYLFSNKSTPNLSNDLKISKLNLITKIDTNNLNMDSMNPTLVPLVHENDDSTDLNIISSSNDNVNPLNIVEVKKELYIYTQNVLENNIIEISSELKELTCVINLNNEKIFELKEYPNFKIFDFSLFLQNENYLGKNLYINKILFFKNEDYLYLLKKFELILKEGLNENNDNYLDIKIMFNFLSYENLPLKENPLYSNLFNMLKESMQVEYFHNLNFLKENIHLILEDTHSEKLFNNKIKLPLFKNANFFIEFMKINDKLDTRDNPIKIEIKNKIKRLFLLKFFID